MWQALVEGIGGRNILSSSQMIIVISMATEKPMMILWMNGRSPRLDSISSSSADVGRHPRQRAQPDDQEQPPRIAALARILQRPLVGMPVGTRTVERLPRRRRSPQAHSIRS